MADTKHTPYGGRSTAFIGQRVHAIAQFLNQQSVKLMVVACNTATAAAVNLLRKQYQIPIIGMEPALKPAVEFSNNECVGVLATQATLESEKYHKLKSRFIKTTKIIEKASPLFVELVESAPHIGTEEFALIEKELKPFVDANVDSLVLGCTHFPFLTQTINQILGDQVTLFESTMPVAQEVKRRLSGNLNSQKAQGNIKYYSSDPVKAKPVFELLLGRAVVIEPFE